MTTGEMAAKAKQGGMTMNQKRCDYCGEFKDQLRATPFLADAGLNMCKECWDITIEAVGDIGEFEDICEFEDIDEFK